MIELDVNKINKTAPYLVTFSATTGLYQFVSEYNVSFGVSFEKNELLESGDSYQFVLTNYEGKKSPRDLNVRNTILAIIEEFFQKNKAALLYICETGDGMQKMRNRLFHSWFGIYAENNEFLFLPQVVYDEEDNENYAALIIRRDNPHFNNLVAEFINTITLLNNKPL